MPVDPDEAQALAYRAQWRRRQQAEATRARGLRGAPAALQALLLRWRPQLMVEQHISVGDETDERTAGRGTANG